MQTFKKLLFLLTPYERKRASLLLFMILVMAFLDMLSVASILPFMTVLTNPGIIETNIILNSMFQASNIFGVENNQQFLFVLGVIVFVTLVISLSAKALITYVQIRFMHMLEFSIDKRLIEGYLKQPYSWFLNRHSADLGKTILSEVGIVIGSGIKPMMELIAKGIVAIAIISLLIITNPKLALMIGLSLFLAYGLLFYFVRRYLQRTGKDRLKNNELLFRAASEAFGAAKEVKVGGLEKIYIRNFSQYAKIIAKTQASSQIIAQLPRFILEAITFGGILLILLFVIGRTGSFNNALPLISLYIFAGYRLMPPLQLMYASFTQLTFVGPSLDKLYEDIKNLKPFKENQDQEALSLKNKITLKNIYYSYPNAPRTALHNINFDIPAKSTVGLIGTTGSGKTTAVDIILGLFEAQKGTLEVDGKIITSQNSRAWQRSIGYVPQQIYLSDDSVSANIAFGKDFKDINQEAIIKVSKIAKLHEFVTEELPNQYQTTIGERGVRLSGGQRQRIGIARALYHNPQVLILDEATSALDNETEKVVMDAINNLSKNITIILIAHRLNTVKNCDIIFKLDKGQLVGQGTYSEIIEN